MQGEDERKQPWEIRTDLGGKQEVWAKNIRGAQQVSRGLSRTRRWSWEWGLKLVNGKEQQKETPRKTRRCPRVTACHMGRTEETSKRKAYATEVGCSQEKVCLIISGEGSWTCREHVHKIYPGWIAGRRRRKIADHEQCQWIAALWVWG